MQVPGVGHGAAQPVGDREGRFRGGGHLHEVDVHVDDAGVPGTGLGGERAVQDGLGLEGAGALGGTAGLQVPQLPGGEVHQRVGTERGHVQVAGGALVHGEHPVRVRLVPHGAVLGRPGLRVAGAQGLDEGLLDGGGVRGLLVREFHGPVGALDGAGELVVVEGFPGLVVVGAEGVGDTPVGHGAVRVGFGGLLEAGDRFLVVEGVRPHQTAVEPELGLGGGRRHGPAVGSEVVVVVHRACLPGQRTGREPPRRRRTSRGDETDDSGAHVLVQESTGIRPPSA